MKAIQTYAVEVVHVKACDGINIEVTLKSKDSNAIGEITIYPPAEQAADFYVGRVLDVQVKAKA